MPCPMGKKCGSMLDKELGQNGSISKSLFLTLPLKWILVSLVSQETHRYQNPLKLGTMEKIKTAVLQVLTIYLLIKISNGAPPKKKRSQKDLVGVSLFLSIA